MIIILSLIFSAFFSGMEIAFVAANRLRVELERKQDTISSSIIDIFAKNPGQYIATMLVGNNIALVIYGIFFAKLIEPLIEKYISSADYSILIIQTLISTLLILITAEFLPKTIFRQNSNKFLKALALPVFTFYILFFPIAKFAVFVSNKLLKSVFKVKISTLNNNNFVFGKVDLGHFLSESNDNESAGKKIDTEVKMFKNALGFSEIKVRECIIPRNEIQAVEVSTEIIDLRQRFIDTGFSKILIYKNSIDNVIGFVHTLDIFKKSKTIKSAMSNIMVVPETMQANKLLDKLIKKRKSIALVVDEFGGTSGIVTLEDLIEEILGEIQDEHDTINLIEEKLNENEYKFSGRLEIDYLNERYKLQLPESQDYETIAGYVFYLHEQIPYEGEILEDDNFKFEILKVNGPKIEIIKLINTSNSK